MRSARINRRASNRASADSPGLELTPVPPFRLDFTAWALRRRLDNRIDRWDGTWYRRAVAFDDGPAELRVRQTGEPGSPRLEVAVVGNDSVPEQEVRTVLTRLLGLEIDLSPFYRLADGDPQLAELVTRFRGLRPPRFPTAFETLVNAITCQQVTLTLGLRIVNRLVDRYGAVVPEAGEDVRAFPDPWLLAQLEPDELRPLQYSGMKARAIIELSRRIVDGMELEQLAELPDSEVREQVMQLFGVGRWTTEYLLLRGFGRLHIFPGDDAGARNGLAAWLGIDSKLDYPAVQELVEPWQPHAGLLYFHLLLNKIASGEASNSAG